MSKHDACHTFIDIFVRNCTEYECVRTCAQTIFRCGKEEESKRKETEEANKPNITFSEFIRARTCFLAQRKYYRVRCILEKNPPIEQQNNQIFRSAYMHCTAYVCVCLRWRVGIKSKQTNYHRCNRSNPIESGDPRLFGIVPIKWVNKQMHTQTHTHAGK